MLIYFSFILSSGGFLGLNDTKALSNQQTSSLTSNGWQVQSRESVNNNPSAPFESAHSFNESSAYEKSLSGNGNSWNSALFDFGTAGNGLTTKEGFHGSQNMGLKVTNSTLNTNEQLSMIPQAPQVHNSVTPPLATAFSESSWNSLNSTDVGSNESGGIFFSQSSEKNSETQWTIDHGAKLKSDTGVSWNFKKQEDKKKI